ncbi:MAG: hypothetical protein A2171_02560 [Candidatus Levybacteria bacterium RBG_13_35_9]|nr:MAG: hypothetical protein A2171_02560 [Candidatus Levybacteria bacterium RBG_13_35_9]
MNKITVFKSRLKKSKIRGLALDIDETISHTAKYWVDVLTVKFGNPEGLTAREIFRKYRRIQEYPHWKTKEALEWMEWAKQADEIQQDIPLIENANHIVNKIHKIKPIVCYITARPDIILPGTKKWLDKHGFPKAEIITSSKSIGHIEASKLKVDLLIKLYPEVVGIVDDNLRLIEDLPSSYKGTLFLYDIEDNISDRENIISCATWEEVYKQIKIRFTSG